MQCFLQFDYSNLSYLPYYIRISSKLKVNRFGLYQTNGLCCISIFIQNFLIEYNILTFNHFLILFIPKLITKIINTITQEQVYHNTQNVHGQKENQSSQGLSWGVENSIRLSCKKLDSQLQTNKTNKNSQSTLLSRHSSHLISSSILLFQC